MTDPLTEKLIAKCNEAGRCPPGGGFEQIPVNPGLFATHFSFTLCVDKFDAANLTVEQLRDRFCIQIETWMKELIYDLREGKENAP